MTKVIQQVHKSIVLKGVKTRTPGVSTAWTTAPLQSRTSTLSISYKQMIHMSLCPETTCDILSPKDNGLDKVTGPENRMQGIWSKACFNTCDHISSLMRIDNNAKTEAPILWPPDSKNQLIGKDSDARKNWGQEEKRVAEDEMVGWHHWLNRHEFEQGLRWWRTGKPGVLKSMGFKQPDIT